MSHEHPHDQVRSRNEPFVARTVTRIWQEEASDDNPYTAAAARCHGYDLFELMAKRSYVDVLYLLFRGELPGQAEAELLQALMIALINPGPRHPATRAAMNAGVGKTNPVHILPIATAVMGGEHAGGGELEAAMRFLQQNKQTDPRQFLAQSREPAKAEAPVLALPGFGTRHGGCELMAITIAQQLQRLAGAGKALTWGCALSAQLQEQGAGWLMTGVAAAVFTDLGFQPRMGGPLFQLLSAPGLLAHGLELANKPITAMPFVPDESYVIER